MDGRPTSAPRTRTTPTGRVLTLHRAVRARADRAAADEILAGVGAMKRRPGHRYNHLARGTVRPLGIAPEAIVDAALDGQPEGRAVHSYARAAVAMVRAAYAALRQEAPHLVRPEPPRPARARPHRRAAA
ncbi:hypothetical protein tb265_39270 [Gemmatimonadetes bacterium T265]|nr:hypothetical protein tb265_39270 [Gemmatimonadetes bacterium T265]